jgi:hypothetical protein
MKIGSLVKKAAPHYQDLIGIIIQVQIGTLRDYVKVRWSHDYGEFWHAKKVLEAISESR